MTPGDVVAQIDRTILSARRVASDECMRHARITPLSRACAELMDELDYLKRTIVVETIRERCRGT